MQKICRIDEIFLQNLGLARGLGTGAGLFFFPEGEGRGHGDEDSRGRQDKFQVFHEIEV